MDKHSPLNPPRVPVSERTTWSVPPGLPLALTLAALGRRKGGPLVVVTPDTYRARRLRDDINRMDGPGAVLFPDWETLPYDLYSPHPDIISRRLELLTRLDTAPPDILIVSVPTLLQRIAPRSFLAGRSLRLGVGERLDREAFRARLGDAGYQADEQVWQPGQFALRGGVIDLWPMGAEKPFRVELFDDAIESIRSFDPETQLSEKKLDRVEMLPAREYPFDEEARQEFRRRFRMRFDVDLRRAIPYQDVGQGHHAQGLEYYLPLFFDETATLPDYLPENARWVLLDGVEKAADEFRVKLEGRFEQRQGDLERPALRPDEIYLPAGEIDRVLDPAGPLWIRPNDSVAETVLDGIPAPELDMEHRAEAVAEYIAGFDGRVIIAADSPGRREMISSALGSLKISPKLLESWSACMSSTEPVVLAVLPFSGGCILPSEGLAILTEAELFPDHARTRQRSRDRSRRDPENLVRSLADLSPGALVVHEDHGIGRYLGLQILDVGDQAAEFITLEYADGDKLYVPVTALELVSRYTAAEAEHVKLHRLGSEQWQKARKKAAGKVRDVAAELLNVHARRASRPGFAFPLDRGMYARFAAGFAYEETDDQELAIREVIRDLKSELPMDRVVCGDVGFGKTEVAMRAAFVVATAGRQVAVLAPTTLLAEQHYRTFSDRFADWPVNVALMSRMGSGKETRKTLDGLADGTVDIVIGTHRLIQKDIKFNDLGLVVVDEEQRFGVRQKERLKALRAEVDLLTLTATPIPRTLNMAMAGLRELSIIATPPARRLAVKTFVSRWDAGVIRDAINREFQRGGQVYFLHNEVRSIERMARELREMFPDARLAVAHGQMAPEDLERVMRGFYSRRTNLLVCTTIIENGIDVSSANTIIINRADKFGLSQLHQLRGRVGRSHHLAYAYLLTPPPKTLTADARKRLEAIQSLEELGAGFSLASHDLEIRGAGELLGDDQSGQIEAVGFAMYSEMLNRAVEALKSGREPDLESPMSVTSEVDLHTTALIPDNYLPDVHQRLVLYKRIAQADTPAKLHDLQVEMIDRFGLLPDPVKNLFDSAELRLQARAMGIRRLEIGPAGGRMEFHPNPSVKMEELIAMVQKESHAYELDGGEKLRILEELVDPEERADLARELLARLRPSGGTDKAVGTASMG